MSIKYKKSIRSCIVHIFKFCKSNRNEMKKIKKALIFLTVLSFFSFNKKEAQLDFESSSIPKDFYFIINSGGNDSYNSKEEIFYRKYSDGVKRVKLQLTEREKEKIYLYMLKINFFKMPVNYKPKEKNIRRIAPSFKESIVIYLNGKKKMVNYDNGYTSDKSEIRAKSFLDFNKIIWSILRQKEEVIKMRESDFFYE